MFDSLRLRIIEPLIVGGYLLLLVIGIQFQTRDAWLGTLEGTTSLAFVAWVISFRRARIIADTPTSRIASAAQGYVELVGRGRHHPGGPILSRVTGLPCIWYRFIIEQKTGDENWTQVNSGRSQESFMLDDGSGRCLVDPDHAEVLTRRKDRWIQGNYRYTEWLILPQAKIYTVGQLSTVGGANSNLDLRQDVSDLLTTWKHDKATLLQRFDLDEDGQINEQEWMLARQQARREVRKEHRQIQLQSGTHIVHKPRDGRLFLISDIDPAKLERRYNLWALFHLLMLFGSVSGIVWVMSSPARFA
jgi:hypothetical protein